MHFWVKWTVLLLTLACVASCQREYIVSPDNPAIPQTDGLIPPRTDCLPKVYLELPQPVTSRTEWMGDVNISIQIQQDGQERTVLEQEGMRIKGRGNSSWNYPKHSYSILLSQKADLVGSGKSTHWALLANWMDRTLLRNDIAFEMARRTSLEWAPSGTFVTLYINGEYQGIYWLGERIHVEGSNFKADYLYSYDTSSNKKEEIAFYSLYGYSATKEQIGDIPIELKHPDIKNYPSREAYEQAVVEPAKEALYAVERSIYTPSAPTSRIDVNSFCDWYLLYEVCKNIEPRHPKSCYFYLRDGMLYAGPVWDFDWATFTPGHRPLLLKNCLYYHQLIPQPSFSGMLKARWRVLKPQFENMDAYIDARAQFIRAEEDRNHQMWPCYPNPLADDTETMMVNHDEDLTFQEAVDRLKSAIKERIADVDLAIRQL